jgi:hypothetical protein
MKSRILFSSIIVIVLMSAPAAAGAKGWYLGGAFGLTSLGDGMVEDIDTGYGLAVDFGYRYSPKFALDFLFGMSFHDEDGNDVEYMRFLGGGKLIFRHPEQLQPYFLAGYESHLLFRSLFDDIDGSGFFFGFGADYYLSETGSLDICLIHSMWDGEIDLPSTSEDVTTDTLSISYVHHFTK